MKTPATLFALSLAAGVAQADSMIDDLCGQGHVNQIAELGDVRANPDGYYVRSFQTQLSHGDPRIVEAVGQNFYLCTRDAATPDMDSSNAINFAQKAAIKYLFVPVDVEDFRPGS